MKITFAGGPVVPSSRLVFVSAGDELTLAVPARDVEAARACAREWASSRPGDANARALVRALDGRTSKTKRMTMNELVLAGGTERIEGLRLSECPGVGIDGMRDESGWLIFLSADNGEHAVRAWSPVSDGRPVYGQLVDLVRCELHGRMGEAPAQAMAQAREETAVRNRETVMSPKKKPSKGSR